MKVVSCRDCDCPHNLHSRKPPYICLLCDPDNPASVLLRPCYGWSPKMSDVKATSAG